LQKALPETLAAEDAALGTNATGQIQQMPWIRAGAVKYGVGALFRYKWARWIGVRKLRERGGKFGFIRVKSRP